MYRNDPKTSGIVTAHFIAADSATHTRVLRYPPPVFYKVPLLDRLGNEHDGQCREYRLESYQFSKFGKQTIAIYREVIKRS